MIFMSRAVVSARRRRITLLLIHCKMYIFHFITFNFLQSFYASKHTTNNDKK